VLQNPQATVQWNTLDKGTAQSVQQLTLLLHDEIHNYSTQKFTHTFQTKSRISEITGMKISATQNIQQLNTYLV